MNRLQMLCRRALCVPIRIYQYTLSPWIGRSCQRHQKDQQAETLQIAQDLKLFHLRCLAFLRLRSWSSHAPPSMTATDSIRVFFRLSRWIKEAEP